MGRKQESEEKQPPTDNHLQEDVDMSKFNNKTQKYLQEVLNKWKSNPNRGFHNYDKKERESDEVKSQYEENKLFHQLCTSKNKGSYQYRKQESKTFIQEFNEEKQNVKNKNPIWQNADNLHQKKCASIQKKIKDAVSRRDYVAAYVLQK